MQPFHVPGEQTLVSCDLLKLHLFAILERAETVPFDAAEVNEDILALRVENEAESLFGIEPLHGAGRHVLLHENDV
jgi:hypothetical protein